MKIFSRLTTLVVALASYLLLTACNGQELAGYWISPNHQEACIIEHVDDTWYSVEILPLKNAKRNFMPRGPGKVRGQYRDGGLHFRFFFADCVAKVKDGRLMVISPQGARHAFDRSTTEEIENLRPKRTKKNR